MPRYVALLSSVNVGGNRLKMADLRAALEAAGFRDVSTVTASGNVIFTHDAAPDAALAEDVAEVVRARSGRPSRKARSGASGTTNIFTSIS